jgi:hypothetical protein
LAISIIVCSVNKKYFSDLVENIAVTIGCDYEIVHEDNSANDNSISSVYNRLGSKAKYSNIVFIHEDVRIYTTNWGPKIIALLNSATVGLVGLMGSVFKSKYPSAWSSVPSKFYRISGHPNSNSANQDLAEMYNNVSVIDGCFIAICKDLFDRYKFDENLLGFHAYDVDLSLNVGRQYQIMVPKYIQYKHFSNGNLNRDWVESYRYIHKKWQNILPARCHKITELEENFCDYMSIQNFYNACYQNTFGFKTVLKFYFILITKFFSLNRLRYTKKTFRYLFNIDKYKSCL